MQLIGGLSVLELDKEERLQLLEEGFSRGAATLCFLSSSAAA